jgi:VIT1/CCC1 family predicted Fe2+/Mn2+ transporter
VSHVSPEPPRPGDRLVLAGALVFGLGLVAAIIVVVPFFFGRTDAALGPALLTLLMPLGLGLALSGLVRGARRGRR